VLRVGLHVFIVVIVFVGVIAYWHFLQGFFSAAISAILAIVAALVAGGLALAGATTVAVITAGALAPLIAVAIRR